MGCVHGKDAEASASGESRNDKAISKSMKQTKKKMAKEIKLLLLGAGESGKSTIFKQMKIIHHDGYTKEECLMYKDIVYSNIITSMKSLINASFQLEIPIENPDNRERAQSIQKNFDNTAMLNISNHFTAELGRDLMALWEDPGIQKTFEERANFQLYDSTEYYFENLERISAPDFVPTEQDVLRSRVKTTGIVETDFEKEGFHFRMFDVGGQRNERKKWIHCFSGVTAVIFVTALSEYDQKCYEDDNTNRMKESLLLFDEICNSRWFTDTPIILFLNKIDLFKEKLEHTNIDVCFPEYKKGPYYDEATDFIAQQFINLNRNKSKPVFPYFTCATDTNNIKNVFDAVQAIILHNNLRDNGLL